MRGRIRLWEGLPDATRKELLAIWRDLHDECGGITRRAARRYLIQVCELWLTTAVLSQEAAKIAGHRATAKGRTSTSPKVRQAAKRAALQMTSLDTAIAKLRALAKEPHLHAVRRRA
jgi:hypothetical protein